MTSIKDIPRQISIKLSGVDDRLIRFRNILKYKKDKEFVTQIIRDVYKLESKIFKIRNRQETQDIFKQP